MNRQIWCPMCGQWTDHYEEAHEQVPGLRVQCARCAWSGTSRQCETTSHDGYLCCPRCGTREVSAQDKAEAGRNLYEA